MGLEEKKTAWKCRINICSSSKNNSVDWGSVRRTRRLLHLDASCTLGTTNCPKTFPIRHMPLFRKCFSKVHFPAIACPSRFDEACVRFLSQLGAAGGPPGQLGVKSPQQMGPKEKRKVKPLRSPENTLPCHVTPLPHLLLLWIKLQRHAFLFNKK